jgi:hypothetical protein
MSGEQIYTARETSDFPRTKNLRQTLVNELNQQKPRRRANNGKFEDESSHGEALTVVFTESCVLALERLPRDQFGGKCLRHMKMAERLAWVETK